MRRARVYGEFASAGSERLAYLDWLRFLVVLSLAPFHAARSYTGYGYVYVYDDPVRDSILAGHGLYGDFGPGALRAFTVFLDNWGTHLLFLVSGMGAAHCAGWMGTRAGAVNRAAGGGLAAGIAYRSRPHGPDDHVVNTAFGGKLVYSGAPDGHAWEVLTVSYERRLLSQDPGPNG